MASDAIFCEESIWFESLLVLPNAGMVVNRIPEDDSLRSFRYTVSSQFAIFAQNPCKHWDGWKHSQRLLNHSLQVISRTVQHKGKSKACNYRERAAAMLIITIHVTCRLRTPNQALRGLFAVSPGVVPTRKSPTSWRLRLYRAPRT
uniref:Uncharacterized protein n=1 Tax=Ciona savignyi TaxID=51511 RepID=H2YZF0_CIOSA